jgi:hypothetical protein
MRLRFSGGAVAAAAPMCPAEAAALAAAFAGLVVASGILLATAKLATSSHSACTVIAAPALSRSRSRINASGIFRAAGGRVLLGTENPVRVVAHSRGKVAHHEPGEE